MRKSKKTRTSISPWGYSVGEGYQKAVTLNSQIEYEAARKRNAELRRAAEKKVAEEQKKRKSEMSEEEYKQALSYVNEELEANREKEHEDFLLKDKIASKLIEPLDILMEQWKNANDNIFAIIEEDYCDSSKLEKTKNHLNVIGNQMSNMMATLISFTKSDAH